jgi:hypothetical protein
MSLVTLQQIPQFQEIQAAVSSISIPSVFVFKSFIPQASTSGSQSSPWFTVHAPHIIMLSGFPPLSHLQTPKLGEPSRTTSHPYPRSPIPDASKRPNEASQSPDTKRQKVVEKASPSLSPRVPGGAGAVGQRTPQLHAPSVAHPAQPSQQPSQQPPQQSSQPLQSSPIPPHATTAPAPTPGKSPVVPAANPLTNAQNSNAASAQQVSMNINTLLTRLKGIEIEIKTIDAKIQDAQSSGNTAAVESLQKERLQKLRVMSHLRNIVVQQMRAGQAAAAVAGSNTGAGGSGETPQPPPPAQVQAQPAVSNNMPEDVVPPTVPAPISVPTEEQKPPVSNQALMQFMQARGGAGGFPSGHPELAAQMKKLINKTGIQPQPFSGSPTPRPAPLPAPVPITQPQPQPQPQASTSSGGPKQWEGSFVVNAASQQAPGFEVQLAVVQCTGDPYVIDRPLWSSINLFR